MQFLTLLCKTLLNVMDEFYFGKEFLSAAGLWLFL
jgi:hypothetical protein